MKFTKLLDTENMLGYEHQPQWLTIMEILSPHLQTWYCGGELLTCSSDTEKGVPEALLVEFRN